MNNPLSAVLALVFAGLCFLATAFMPWAELGLLLNGSGVGHLLEPMQRQFVTPELLAQVKKEFPKYTEAQALEQAALRSQLPYYQYAIFLGMALFCAASAYAILGREEVEKTIVPAKK